jgi:hypothetical protein
VTGLLNSVINTVYDLKFGFNTFPEIIAIKSVAIGWSLVVSISIYPIPVYFSSLWTIPYRDSKRSFESSITTVRKNTHYGNLVPDIEFSGSNDGTARFSVADA